jgi:DNA-binding beta-propeller fold protein YncE
MDCSIGHCTALSPTASRRLLLAIGLAFVAAGTTAAASEPCGSGSYPFPYTDVATVTDPFCPGIMEAYVTGVSRGTTPTTFSPNDDVPRLQMTTFLQRSLDQGITRASRRAALNQWWTPQTTIAMRSIALDGTTEACAADGMNVWTLTGAGHVAQIQASTGTNLRHWTGAAGGVAMVLAAGEVFVTANTAPGTLYVFDPTQPPGAVTTASNALGNVPVAITFDGTNLWTANDLGSISVIEPISPYGVLTFSSGFSSPSGILFDGAYLWVTDYGAGALLKIDPSDAAILKTVTVGDGPASPVFDGTNIWVPNFLGNSITVVQASSGKVVATISADATNQLNGPAAASFDGERILVPNGTGNSVTLFKAADLSFIANVPTGAATDPVGACNDGVYFWITLNKSDSLLRF